MNTKQKYIIVSVTNDLVTDQRVHKICSYLETKNYAVLLVGRKLPSSLSVNRTYKTKRMRLFFTKGPLFYLSFNARLFLFLLFHKADVLLSNDLDTLLPNYLVSKLKGSELVYDSHEYFTEVTELVNRPTVKRIWEKLENWIFPNLKNAYTVNDRLAKIYSEKYKVPVKSIMNLPYYAEVKHVEKNSTFTVIYQGALNKDRGLEELIEAFLYLENMQLWIVGEGDLSLQLRELTRKLNLNNRITFKGQIPFEQLKNVTVQAHLGVSLEKDTNPSYRVATPNKVFDYISANLPVLTCELPEIKNIVHKYGVGWTISEVEPKIIAQNIQEIYNNKAEYQLFSEQTKKAAKELCWENQIRILDTLFDALPSSNRYP